MEKSIKVGVGVLIIKDNKVLLGHRVNKIDTGGIYEPDSWSCPGGKQDYDETILDCAIREVKEETDLDLKVEDLKVFSACDDIQPDKHYITVHVIASNYSGEPKVMEPDKNSEWVWFDLDNLPDNVYSPSKNEINCYKDYINGR